MRKLPIGPLSYQVWYIDNPDDPSSQWNMMPANTLPEAFRIMENLTQTSTGARVNSHIYIIEFKGKIIGEQTNDYPV